MSEYEKNIRSLKKKEKKQLQHQTENCIITILCDVILLAATILFVAACLEIPIDEAIGLKIILCIAGGIVCVLGSLQTMTQYKRIIKTHTQKKKKELISQYLNEKPQNVVYYTAYTRSHHLSHGEN